MDSPRPSTTSDSAASSAASGPLRVLLVGAGTVGTGVAALVAGEEHRDRTQRRAGRTIEIAGVLVRDPAKPRELPAGLAVSRFDADALSPERLQAIDVVCELIGGTTTAREVVSAALAAGCDVVTANKALLCEYGPELFAAARETGASISFEAAVAGGIPVIATIASSMTANQIEGLAAILNGTSNYILTEMLARGQSYGDALAAAQELGYAEADPTMDVDGTDAAQKLAILVQLAFGTRVTPADFQQQGIDRITLRDLVYAAELGFKIKLLSTARLRRAAGAAGRLELHVQPTLVRESRPLAQVDGAFNVVEITGDAVGRVMLTGPGAGQMPTASAVVADLIDVATGRAARTFARLDLRSDAHELLPSSEVRRQYYLRIPVLDQPGQLAGIAQRLGDQGISIASVIQHEGDGTADTAATGDAVPLVIMTHQTTEAAVARATEGLDGLCLPVVAD